MAGTKGFSNRNQHLSAWSRSRWDEHILSKSQCASAMHQVSLGLEVGLEPENRSTRSKEVGPSRHMQSHHPYLLYPRAGAGEGKVQRQ